MVFGAMVSGCKLDSSGSRQGPILVMNLKFPYKAGNLATRNKILNLFCIHISKFHGSCATVTLTSIDHISNTMTSFSISHEN